MRGVAFLRELRSSRQDILDPSRIGNILSDSQVISRIVRRGWSVFAFLPGAMAKSAEPPDISSGLPSVGGDLAMAVVEQGAPSTISGPSPDRGPPTPVQVMALGPVPAAQLALVEGAAGAMGTPRHGSGRVAAVVAGDPQGSGRMVTAVGEQTQVQSTPKRGRMEIADDPAGSMTGQGPGDMPPGSSWEMAVRWQGTTGQDAPDPFVWARGQATRETLARFEQMIQRLESDLERSNQQQQLLADRARREQAQ